MTYSAASNSVEDAENDSHSPKELVIFSAAIVFNSTFPCVRQCVRGDTPVSPLPDIDHNNSEVDYGIRRKALNFQPCVSDQPVMASEMTPIYYQELSR